MRGLSRSSLFLLVCISVMAAGGCARVSQSWHNAKASFPIKQLYHPSYRTIGAMYKRDPSLSVDFMERLARKKSGNMAYKLTLADMYKDRGRANDAIRLWFDILALSRERGIVDGSNLEVYFIPIAPYQEESIGPYEQTIDRALAYEHIGRIYLQNYFFEEAAEAFSSGADDPMGGSDRRAELYLQAGRAVGMKQVVPAVSEKEGRRYGSREDSGAPVDAMRYRKQEKDFYEKALALDINDPSLQDLLERDLAAVTEEIDRYEGRAPAELKGVEASLIPAASAAPSFPEQERDLKGDGLDLFEEGEIEQAAGLWRLAFEDFPEEAFLIQVETDCEVNSIRQTYEKLGKPEEFFLLPKIFKGRSCYRLFLGPYPDGEEAREQASTLKGRIGHDQARVTTVLPMLEEQEVHPGATD